MSKQIAIIVLGGGLRKTEDGWSTTTFKEGDNFGASGDYLRPKAAAILYKRLFAEGKDVSIIASGGKGQYAGVESAPNLADVLTGEMIAEGVPVEIIVKEIVSNNTFQQLHEFAKVLSEKDFDEILIVSNKYQLPRVKAFIEVNKDLNKFYKNFKLISAEEVLVKDNPKKWREVVARAYGTKAMKERMALEKSGEKQIRNGTYHYKTNYSGKIKTAIIGLGKITWAYEEDPLVTARMDFPTHHSVLRQHPKFELSAVQDKSAKAREEFSKKRPGIKIYKSWEEMIKKERPDLLVVASNTESHIEICNRAIDLGVKNILCEKPIGYSLKESLALVKKAEKNKCNLFINYLRAFNPSYQDLFAKIKFGHFGRIQSFDAKYAKGIYNNGTHMIDLLLRMFGEVKKVQGFKNPTRITKEKDPTISAGFEFSNGISGYMHGLNADFYGAFELEILAEGCRIKIVGDKNEDSLVDIKNGLHPVYDNIYSCISSGDFTKNSCSARESLRSISVADRIIKSI